jgi:hypothetical protein
MRHAQALHVAVVGGHLATQPRRSLNQVKVERSWKWYFNVCVAI